VWNFVMAVETLLIDLTRFLPNVGGTTAYVTGEYVGAGVTVGVRLVVGLVLVLGADTIARMVYGPEALPSANNASSAGQS
jgi:hypothetical protein